MSDQSRPSSGLPDLGGRFISVEGGDGAGKSTQIQRLAETLREQGCNVVVTREPGGSPGAEAIRDLLVKGSADRWSPMTEALLMFAARRDHLEKTILPALKGNAVVISDRYVDSSIAYQGYAGGLGAETIAALGLVAIDGHLPDLTLIIDVSAQEGLARAQTQNGEGRFEDKGDDYQARVRAAFLEIAAAAPERCIVIDGNGDIDMVHERVIDAVARHFGDGR